VGCYPGLRRAKRSAGPLQLRRAIQPQTPPLAPLGVEHRGKWIAEFAESFSFSLSFSLRAHFASAHSAVKGFFIVAHD
jgi:hypothetical protein